MDVYLCKMELIEKSHELVERQAADAIRGVAGGAGGVTRWKVV